MTLSVTHNFTSLIPDDPASASAGEVLPSHWNAAHALTGVADVSQGGTGAASFTANQAIFAGATALEGAIDFTRTAAGGRYLFGATDDGVGKVQVNGDMRVQGTVYNNGNEISLSSALSLISSGGVTLQGQAGGSINSLSGDAPNDTADSGAVNFTTGMAGGISGDSGSQAFSIGVVVEGNAGQFNFVGATGIGTNNVGTGAFYFLGNADDPANSGTFNITDLAGSGMLTYAPVGDLLTVGNLQFGAYTAGLIVQTGYMNVKDSAGNTRRLLVG